MTVRAIYNIKMNSLTLAPDGIVGSLSRLMQMRQITVWLLKERKQDKVGEEKASWLSVVIHLVDFSLQA